jgi:hypothetical protein
MGLLGLLRADTRRVERLEFRRGQLPAVNGDEHFVEMPPRSRYLEGSVAESGLREDEAPLAVLHSGRTIVCEGSGARRLLILRRSRVRAWICTYGSGIANSIT